MSATPFKQQFAGWFATSFWVDCHYALAALGTLIIFAVYAATRKFDLGFAGFVAALWTTAFANDRLNMPAIPPPVVPPVAQVDTSGPTS